MDRHFLRDRLRAFRRGIRCLLPDVKCTLYGCNITIPAALHRGVLAKVRMGDYETPERKLIEQHLRSDVPVIELGGSLGVVTAFAAKRLNSDTVLISVEANPSILPYCRKNLDANRVGPGEVLHRVVAYGSKTAQFYVSDNIHISRTDPFPGAKRIDVGVTSVTEILGKIKSENFQLIMDIEGAEVDVIREEAGIFSRCLLAIIEFHPYVYSDSEGTIARMISALNEQGLELIDVLETTYAFKRK